MCFMLGSVKIASLIVRAAAPIALNTALENKLLSFAKYLNKSKVVLSS